MHDGAPLTIDLPHAVRAVLARLADADLEAALVGGSVRDAVMGSSEPRRETALPHEVGLVMEVVAVTQEMADTICAFARATLMHHHYPGRKATAGNLALPFAPSDVPLGPVYRFNVYHLLEVEDPCVIFPLELVEYGA